jgi:hypothetical protein
MRWKKEEGHDQPLLVLKMEKDGHEPRTVSGL